MVVPSSIENIEAQRLASIEAGARAFYLSRGAADYEWDALRKTEDGERLYQQLIRGARACAKAWGFKFGD